MSTIKVVRTTEVQGLVWGLMEQWGVDFPGVAPEPHLGLDAFDDDNDLKPEFEALFHKNDGIEFFIGTVKDGSEHGVIQYIHEYPYESQAFLRTDDGTVEINSVGETSTSPYRSIAQHEELIQNHRTFAEEHMGARMFVHELHTGTTGDRDDDFKKSHTQAELLSFLIDCYLHLSEDTFFCQNLKATASTYLQKWDGHGKTYPSKVHLTASLDPGLLAQAMDPNVTVNEMCRLALLLAKDVNERLIRLTLTDKECLQTET